MMEHIDNDSSAGDKSPLPAGKSPSPRLCWVETQEPTSQVPSPLPEPRSGEVTPVLLFINEDNLMPEEVAQQEAEQVEDEPPAKSAHEATSQEVLLDDDDDDDVLVDDVHLAEDQTSDHAVEQRASPQQSSSEASLMSLKQAVETAALTQATQDLLTPATDVEDPACGLTVQPDVTTDDQSLLLTISFKNSIQMVHEDTLSFTFDAPDTPTVPETPTSLGRTEGTSKPFWRRVWSRFRCTKRTAPTTTQDCPVAQEESTTCIPLRQMLRRFLKRNK
ncbi:uncharacterized protein LOC121720804 [Alosa sapidissima]|uniref:uncharacterized protein LOC121720804 n=1 Tax=Alosa sapidissima TaxID=34773 RepID=UPI001C0967C6|nr:uncharacterized protein LOC121720804 [Alosa sapidissima]